MISYFVYVYNHNYTKHTEDTQKIIKEGYKTQLDFYAYLLKGMGFKVSKDAYLYICNAKEIDEGFHGKMLFDEILVHYEVKTDYLDNGIQNWIYAR